MKKGIYGKKLGMTQIFDNEGLVIPVTVVEVEPSLVFKFLFICIQSSNSRLYELKL